MSYIPQQQLWKIQKGHNGDKKKKLKINRVLCKNIERLIMYFNNSWNKSRVSWEHYKNTKDLASTTMQSYLLGLEGEIYIYIYYKEVGYFCAQSKLLHHCLLCIS